MSKAALQKLNDFYNQFKLLTFKKGETLLHAGEVPPGIFYLKKGFARVYSLSPEGEELTLIIFKPEDCFPITWAIKNFPNDYWVEAITHVEAWRVPRNKFREFIRNEPDVFYELTSRVLVRLRGLLTRMEYLAFGDAYSKVASILAICAERFGNKRGKNIIISVPLTHKDIASLVGLTRETTSVEMKKLQDKKIVGHRNHFLVVKSMLRLKREARLPL